MIVYVVQKKGDFGNMKRYIKSNSYADSVPDVVTGNYPYITVDLSLVQKYDPQYLSDAQMFVNDVLPILAEYLERYSNKFSFSFLIDCIDSSRMLGKLDIINIKVPYTRRGSNGPTVFTHLPYSSGVTKIDFSMFDYSFGDYMNRAERGLADTAKGLSGIDGVPHDVVKAAHLFRHWIVDEHLGRHAVDDEGRAWLMSRTIDNPRSSLYNDYDSLYLLNELFDFCKANNYTIQQLKKLAKNADIVYRRI